MTTGDAPTHGTRFGRGLGAATFVVLAILFVGLTVLFDHVFRGARLDLTENRLYTLSAGTERLVSTLREPVNLYFFYSREASEPVPQLRTYATRVRELLEEIAARSDGKVRLHVVDPVPYSEDEDRANEFGLRAVPLGPTGDGVYLGLAGTNSTDGRATIEFFNPQKEEFLEYDVARLIHELAVPKRKVVGLLSTLPVAAAFDPASGGMRPSWAIDDAMRELFEVRTIAPDATVLPAELDVLMVVHPKGLSPALAYAIDQYVLGGGRLLLFVDPDAQQDPSGAERTAYYAGSDRASTFEPLLAAWGVKYDAGRVFGDLEHALLVGDPGGGAPERHLAFLGFGAGTFASGDVITAALDTVNLATPGFLVPTPVKGVTFEPLLTSGTQSAPISTEKLAMAVTADGLRSGFEPTGERYVAAARVSGALPSAFPGGPPAGVAARAPHLQVAAKPANVVVVADTDLLSDMLWVRTQTVFGQRYSEAWANNGDFVLNALDNLTGSADLISIRARATFSRPFTRVDALRAQADDRLRAKEIELERELAATEQKLVDLQRRREDQASVALSPDQQRELERFQQEKVRVRKELREVRRGLDEEIERLGATLRLLNVAAVPALLSLAALAVLALRRRRRRAGAHA